MDVLTNNRIQVANCNISGLTTCITNTNSCVGSVLTCVQGVNSSLSTTNTCVSNVLGCVQGANSNISGLQTCIQNTNSCNSSQQTCLGNLASCDNSIISCLAGKSQGKLGMELIGQQNANYTGCVCTFTPGKFQSYKIIGAMCCWTYYCSQLTFGFFGGCSQGCSANNAGSWCCNQFSCGYISNGKCWNGSYQYTCAGAIAWPFGCSSTCYTACSGNGFAFEIDIWPTNLCAYDRGFKYRIRNYGGSNGGGQMCCTGIENFGYGCNCCGADPSCLQYVCFTTPSASCTVGCMQVAIYGLNRLAC